MTLNREDEKEDGNRYYDHIRFPNITTADVNCDGYEEIVVAGYYNEVKEEKTYGFLANSDTDASNMGYAVYYSENDAITNVQKIAMSSYTAGGTNNNGVKPKPAMTGVAINGRGTPEQVFIAGALYEVQENGGLNLLCDTTREKNSSARWWWYYQDAIAGNFDHNTEGREQVIALAAERQNGTKNARKFDLFTDVFYGEDFGSGTLSVAGKYTATAEKDEYSKLCHAVDLAWDMPYNCILLAADVNKDGLFARYEGKGYGYSDAQVQAVLQAAPYFAELGDYDLDFSDGSTTYTFSSGYSDTKSSSHNTSFGASIVAQGDLKVWRYEATLGYTMDFTKSTEDTLSKEYSASFNAGGNDSVVLYRVPATTYYYSLYDPQKGDFDLSERNTIALMIPGQPVYTMLDREYYDEFAVLYNETYKKDKMCIRDRYYTGIDPRDMTEVYVARSPHEKALQRALLQWGRKDLRPLVIEALEKAERTDLIGYEEKCLIRPQKGEKYFGKKPEEPTRPDRREKPRGGNFRHKRPENPGQKGKMPQRKKEAFAKRRKGK